MRVKLEFITPNAEEAIGRYASICYNSKTDRESCIKRAAHCVDSGHLATMRFAHATFHVEGISRVCSHQFVRSKHLDFLQRSQRYCKELDASFVMPPSLPSSAKNLLSSHYENCEFIYEQLLGMGVKKEDARFALADAVETEMNVTGNLQAWKNFIELRSGKHAQWEIRQVAIEINNILAAECPSLFKEILNGES